MLHQLLTQEPDVLPALVRMHTASSEFPMLIEWQEGELRLVALTPFYSRGFVLRARSCDYRFEPGPVRPPLEPVLLLDALIGAYAGGLEPKSCLVLQQDTSLKLCNTRPGHYRFNARGVVLEWAEVADEVS